MNTQAAPALHSGPGWDEWADAVGPFAAATGLIRMSTGLGAPAGTLVNIAWVVFDLLILSVIVRAALYKGFNPPEEAGKEGMRRGVRQLT